MNNINPSSILFQHDSFFNAYYIIQQLSSNKFNDSNLNNKLTMLYFNNKNTIDIVIQFSIFIKNRLRQKVSKETLNTIYEIEKEINNKKNDKLFIDKLKNEKQLIEMLFKEEINETIEMIHSHNELLSIQYRCLNDALLRKEIDKLIKNEEELSINLDKEIESFDENIKKTKAQIDVITQSELIIHKQKITELFSGKIPLKDEIMALNVDESEKDVLGMLIRLLEQFFSHVSKGFSYKKLVETRHQLVEEYLSYIRKQSLLKKQKRGHLFTLTRYHELMTVDDQLAILTQQILWLAQYWQSLTTQLIQLKTDFFQADTIITPHFAFLDAFTCEHEKFYQRKN